MFPILSAQKTKQKIKQASNLDLPKFMALEACLRRKSRFDAHSISIEQVIGHLPDSTGTKVTGEVTVLL